MAVNVARIAGRSRPSSEDDSQMGGASGLSRPTTTDDRASLVSSIESLPQSNYALVSELEMLFRPIHVTPYIVTHMVMLLSLFIATLLLPFPFLCKYRACHVQTYTLQVLLHVVAWLASAVLHMLLHKAHFRSYIRGYSDFHYMTRKHRKLPFVVYSVGNSLLLIFSLILRESPPPDQPEPTPYPSQWPLSAFHYAQVVTALEMLILFPALVKYLRHVVRFNAAQSPPDVADEDPELRGRRRQPVTKDDAAYNWRLMRRQADCIQQLRAHNTMLGRKIVELNARVTAAEGARV